MMVVTGFGAGPDEDGRVAAAALQHEQVVFQLLDLDGARLRLSARRRLLVGCDRERHGYGREQSNENGASCHVGPPPLSAADRPYHLQRDGAFPVAPANPALPTSAARSWSMDWGMARSRPISAV
jgi:hypothetical protein